MALRRYLVYAICTALPLLSGCSKGMSESQVANAEQAFSQAQAAFEQKDHATALQKYNEAFQAGGLRSDMAAEVYINRAICHAELGNFAAAEADLQIAEQGAPQMDQVHAARGHVLYKKGDKKAAAEHFRTAQRLNPRFRIPEM